MLSNNSLIKDYKQEEVKVDKPVDFEQIIPTVDEVLDFSELKKVLPLDYIRQNGRNGEIEIETFVKHYDETTLNNLIRKAEVFSPRPHLIKILE